MLLVLLLAKPLLKLSKKISLQRFQAEGSGGCWEQVKKRTSAS